MFSGCRNLTTIYAGDAWSTASVTNSASMFMDCTRLVGGMGTGYDATHVSATYAHIDGGPSDPGYFTQGPSHIPGDVNHDGEVNIADVNAVITQILTGAMTPDGDVNGDGEVNIRDINAVISIILA